MAGLQRKGKAGVNGVTVCSSWKNGFCLSSEKKGLAGEMNEVEVKGLVCWQVIPSERSVGNGDKRERVVLELKSI